MNDSEHKNPETECIQAHEYCRFFLQYRTKIFHFFIVINGAILTITIVHKIDGLDAILLPIVGVIVSIVSIFAEYRSYQLGKWHTEAAKNIEKKLGWSLTSQVESKSSNSIISLRVINLCIYVCFGFFWVYKIFCP